jgi:hypothetical protein
MWPDVFLLHTAPGLQVEPFPLPDLLPLCGLAPAALHAVVEGALAPLVDAAFSPATTSSAHNTARLASCRPGDMSDALLQIASQPWVENGGVAVRLQMAVEVVAYFAALTALGPGDGALPTLHMLLFLQHVPFLHNAASLVLSGPLHARRQTSAEPWQWYCRMKPQYKPFAAGLRHKLILVLHQPACMYGCRVASKGAEGLAGYGPAGACMDGGQGCI